MARPIRDRLAHISRLERALKVTLPGTYIAFLVEHYGQVALSRPVGFRVGVVLEPADIEILEQLYTIGTGDIGHELLPNACSYRDYLPLNRLLVGRVANGDALCVALDGTTPGAIGFWAWDGTSLIDRGNLALSIQSFLNRVFEL